MQQMEDKKLNCQKARFVFGEEEIECKIEWIEGDKDFDVRFMDPHTGWQNSNPSSSRNNWYYQDAEANMNHNSLVNAVQQWEDWDEHLTWEDGAEDEFEFEWDGESYEGYTDAEGNPEYKELTRK